MKHKASIGFAKIEWNQRNIFSTSDIYINFTIFSVSHTRFATSILQTANAFIPTSIT